MARLCGISLAGTKEMGGSNVAWGDWQALFWFKYHVLIITNMVKIALDITKITLNKAKIAINITEIALNIVEINRQKYGFLRRK